MSAQKAFVFFGLLFLIGIPFSANADNTQFIQVLTPFIEQHRGNGCRVYSLSCVTNNPGAVSCASVVRGQKIRPTCTPQVHKYQGRSCGKPNDTACFETDDRGIAAMADVFLRKIRNGCRSIFTVMEGCERANGQFMEGYSSSRSGNNSRAYANQIGQWAGVNPDMSLDPNNAIVMGKILVAMARYESGRGGIKFTAQQLLQGLSYAYGTATVPAGTPGFESTMVTPPPPGTFTLAPGAGLLTPGSILSPFSGQPLAPPNASSALPAPLGSPINVPVDQPLTSVNTSGGQGTDGPIFVNGGVSIGKIIVQPQSARRGASVVVSWSSVNMKPSSCKVTANGTQISTNSEGVQVYKLSTQVSFALQCTTARGGAFEDIASVTAQ